MPTARKTYSLRKSRASICEEEELARKQPMNFTHLNLFGEGGGEHHGLSSLVGAGPVVLLDDPTDMGLEAHIEHTIGFVKKQEPEHVFNPER